MTTPARGPAPVKVLVTGATGFLGSHACRRLVESGHRVTVLARPRSDLRTLSGLEVEHLIGDVTDPDAIDAAARGQDAIVHAAAARHRGAPAADSLMRINVEGTRHVVTACLRHRARLLHVSSTAAVGIPLDRNHPADETFAFNLEGCGLPYHVSKHLAEQEVQRGVARGLDAVVVNPSEIHGPFGTEFRGSAVPRRIERSRIVPCFPGGLCVVHVEDVVDGLVAALARGQRGERYILGGENLTHRELAAIAGRALGLQRTLVTLPRWVTWLAATASRAATALAGRPIGRDVHTLTDRFFFYDSAKARRALGFRPRPYAEIAREYAARVVGAGRPAGAAVRR